jgi:hypothetical protein
MRRSVREALVGFSLLAAVASGMGLWLWLRGVSLTGNTWTIRASFADAAGLAVRSPVTYRGVLVGNVRKVTVTDAAVVADLEITNPRLRLARPLVARVASASLLGGDAQVALLAGGGSLPSSLPGPRDRACNNTEFLFMVNHLYRGSDEGRHKQGELLNAWARTQTLPVIAVGDYNFDYLVEGGDQGSRDLGYNNLTKDDIWTWVRPATLDTTTAPNRRRPGAVLDFIFASGNAKKWPATSEIVKLPGEFSDREKMSDHRPIVANFDLPGECTPPPPPTKPDPALREQQLRDLDEQINQLRKQLKELEDRRKKIE